MKTALEPPKFGPKRKFQRKRKSAGTGFDPTGGGDDFTAGGDERVLVEITPPAGVAFVELLLEPPIGATDQVTDPTHEDLELLLGFLVDAPSRHISFYRRKLRDRCTPQLLLDVALRAHGNTAREDYLTFASSLLEEFGNDAWAALRQLARSKTAECELFVRQVVRCPGVPARVRMAALTDLAENPHTSVRSRLLDCLPELPDSERRLLLQKLIDDQDPEIRARAHEDLPTLED